MQKTGRWDLQAHSNLSHNFIEIDNTGQSGHFLSNLAWRKKDNRLETRTEFKARIYRELILAKEYLEQALDKNVNTFAFSFGDYGQNTINFAEAEAIITSAVSRIYTLSFYQVWSGEVLNYPYQDQFMAKRINVEANWLSEDVLDILVKGRY